MPPWTYEELDRPPQQLFSLLSFGVTDQFLVTFIWFGGLALLVWAVVEKLRND